MSLATAVRAVVTEVDPDQTMYNVRAETERIAEQIGPWRFFMLPLRDIRSAGSGAGGDRHLRRDLVFGW